ncbi:MAG: hypothetical protein ACOH2T_19270 [Pseudomonas sp.]
MRDLLPLFVLIFLLGIIGGCMGRAQVAQKDALYVQNQQLTKEAIQQTVYLEEIRKQAARAKELNDALNEIQGATHDEYQTLNDQNQSLRSDLAVAKRMQLKGSSCAATPGATKTPSGSLVAEVPVELSEVTRQLVFDLRQSILRDQEVIQNFQDHDRILAEHP